MYYFNLLDYENNNFFKNSSLVMCYNFTFACSEIDNLNLDNEFAKKQEVSNQVDKETFVSLDKATEIADLFFSKLTEGNVSTRSGLRAQSGSASIETLSESGSPLMYIINYPDGGFVIMGTTKNYYPVLAYSDKNSFEVTSEMNGVSDWLEETKEAIKTSDASNDTIKSGMQNLWKNYETADIPSSLEAQDAQLRSSSYSSGEIACWNRCDELQMQYGSEGWNFLPLSQVQSVFDDAGFPGVYDDLCYSANFNNSPYNCSVVGWKNVYENVQVGPLLNTEWHQNSPYNNLIPNGYDAGCGAIAIAQILKYHQWPPSLTYNGYTFGWNSINNNTINSPDIPYLIALTGFVANTNYGSSGSWASPENVENAFKWFDYNVTRAGNDYNKVEKELLSYQRPVFMMGGHMNLPGNLSLVGKGHYWVCDGARRITSGQIQYFTEWQPNGNGAFTTGWYSMNFPCVIGGIGYLYFHMNWGGGGKYDGWFAFNSTSPGNGDNYQYGRDNIYVYPNK